MTIQKPSKKPISRQRLYIWLLASIGFAYSSRAQAQLVWGSWEPSVIYDSGFSPAVAVSGSTIVEVHNAENIPGPMWYRVGKMLAGFNVQWGPSYYFDNGFHPTVAISGSTVVEVNNAGKFAGPMLYRVGRIIGETIQWGDSHEYGNGFNPSIAIASCDTSSVPNCGLLVIAAHNAGTSAGAMWYHVGRVNAQTIQWGDSYQYDNGFNPSVGMQPCVVADSSCGMTIVEVHNAGDTPSAMWYRVGRWTKGSSITWYNSMQYDQGWNPKVAVSGQYALEVHSAGNTLGSLWYHLGYLGTENVDMGLSHQYNRGSNPSVAIDRQYGTAVEVHEGDPGALWYHSALFNYVGDLPVLRPVP
jgi:hypothetical protein